MLVFHCLARDAGRLNLFRRRSTASRRQPPASETVPPRPNPPRLPLDALPACVCIIFVFTLTGLEPDEGNAEEYRGMPQGCAAEGMVTWNCVLGTISRCYA